MTKEDGLRIKEARRARVRRIHARVLSASVALFLAVWMLITVALVTGHDPALARKTATQATTGSTSGATTAVTTTSSGSVASTGTGSTSGSINSAGSTGSGSSTSAGSSGSTSGVSPVTSSQS